MNFFTKSLTFFLLLFFSMNVFANEKVAVEQKSLLERPLMERYIVDELKALRIENSQLKIEVERRITKAQIEQTDRAAQYMTDTIGNIFYLIAGATSILVFSGWNSLRDIRSKTENIVEERLNKITQQYSIEMESLQNEMTLQSKNILENQNKIYNNQYVHSLWMRSNLETNTQSRIEIYNEILKINNNDAEAYAYKADAVIDMDEYVWALNLSNKAIEIDSEYGYAYWQRSCANAALGNTKDAVSDLAIALEKSPNLHDEIDNEKLFEDLKETEEFKDLLA
ncbi:tetratricopeptide repeat protein [Arcobacteraceae bacterium]|nr:tetratricopeptide repeat protein [Arcobacteraceae bacterium]